MNKTFATLLNENNLLPTCRKGQVTLVRTEYDAESCCWEETQTSQEDLDKVGFLEGYVEEHPEGSDRGGFVPTVYSKDGQTAYHDENAGVWY